MITNPYGQYRDVQVQTASPGRLLIMLYDGAIRFANLARRGIEASDPKMTYEGMRRTQDILDYLTATLDPNAGVIATNLAELYEFMGQRLLEANLRRDASAVVEVVGLLEEIRGAYAAIIGSPATAEKPALAAAVSNAG
jgi:flagellar protein FliS